jgi:hypothetical protein
VRLPSKKDASLAASLFRADPKGVGFQTAESGVIRVYSPTYGLGFGLQPWFHLTELLGHTEHRRVVFRGGGIKPLKKPKIAILS